MKDYIGTKQIKATKMTRGEYAYLQGLDHYENWNSDEPGYLVEYALMGDGQPNHPDFDGYISWSPKDVFEAAYRENGALTFGDAIYCLKHGLCARRKGWNGKGMFIWLNMAKEIQAKTCSSSFVKKLIEDNGGSMMGLGTIFMYTAQKELLFGWLASQTDMLAEDWVVFEHE